MAPSRRASAGASTAWSQCVWPISTARAGPMWRSISAASGSARRRRSTLRSGTRLTYGSTQDRDALVRQAVPGHAEPLELEPGGQAERDALELGEGLEVAGHTYGLG